MYGHIIIFNFELTSVVTPRSTVVRFNHGFLDGRKLCVNPTHQETISKTQNGASARRRWLRSDTDGRATQ